MPPAKRPRSDESGSRQSPPQTHSDFARFATQHPSATVTSGAYQALAEAAEESFSEPSYVVVNETVKQFPATGGVLAETSLNSTGSSGANSSFEGPQAMNLLQDTLKSFSSWMEREQIIRYNDQQQRKEEFNLLKELVRGTLPKNH